MHAAVHGRRVLRAVAARDHHVCADGKPDKEVDEQVDERRGRADRGQRGASGKVAHHDDVRGVE